jgi:type IV pilus biogenesis/stability protein PilW
MKNFVACSALAVSLLLIHCGEKKPTETEIAEAEQEYNYREAIRYHKIGINAINNGNVNEALENLEKAVKIDPENYRYQHWVAFAHSMAGNLKEAEAHLLEAIRINDAHTESHNLLGTVYIEMGRYEEAVDHLRLVIQDKSYPEPQFPYFNLGKCLRKQNRNDQAIAAFELAAQYDPEFHRVYIALGEIYRERQEYERMLYYYLKAEPSYPNDTSVLFSIGLAHFKLEHFDRAKKYLAQVSILFPPPAIDNPTQQMLHYIDAMENN